MNKEWFSGVAFVMLVTLAPHAFAWEFYGNDAGGSKFSALDQINRATVKNLEVAWTYQTGDTRRATFEATPVF